MTDSFSTDGIGERLEHAVACARAGGALALEYFKPGVVAADRKADGSPVTAADRACEKLIRTMIRDRFPQDGLLGEEFGDEPASQTPGFRWIIDPIDGTFSFMHGVPLYTTLIGIEAVGEDEERSGGTGAEGVGSGRMVAGVIYAPALDEMVYARTGGGAWHTVGNEAPNPARVTTTPTLDSATVSSTSMDYWDDPSEWTRLHAKCAHTRGWPDAYAVLLVATGRCDAVVESNVHAWDVAPFGPILSEAGGRSTDWVGGTSAHTDSVIASNGHLHGALLSFLGR